MKQWRLVIGLIVLPTMMFVVNVGAQETEPLTRILATTAAGGPITPDGEEELYRMRYGAGLQFSYIPANLRILAATFGLDYRLLPVRLENDSVNLQTLRAEAGAQFRLPIGSTFAAFLYGSGGYGGASLSPRPDFAEDSSDASSFSYRAGVGFEGVFGPLIVSADVGWDSFVDILDGITGRVGVGWQFGGRGSRGTPTRGPLLPTNPQPLVSGARANLAFSDYSVEPVFPVLYKFYDDNPLGTVTITNAGEETLEEVEIVLDMETYIDNPKVSGRFEAIGPGESVQVELAALFNPQVQTITEGEKIAAVIQTSFVVDGASGTDEETVTIDFYDRNAIRWDDDNKVAAFVTTRDTQIQPLARNLAALARQNRRDAVSSNFQLGVMMFLGMVDQGLAYVIDPTSAYEELSQNPLAIDSVQFPRQTLNFRGGDCDDLSVLFATLMESVGVPTAFLTIPGHIFVAFQLDMTADEAESTFAQPRDLIFRDDGSVWVPVEITLLESGFVEAWTTGAQQWREYAPAGRAGFFPTAEAWNTYLPVAYNGDEQIRAFNENAIAQEFTGSMTAFVKREIADRELAIKSRLQRSPDNVRLHNRLGVLYARYGLTEDALLSFQEAIDREEYAPALANLGNIAFLEDDFFAAEDYYSRALDADPRDEAGLLGLARVSHELENYGTVTRYYEQVKELNPSLALQFSYLELRGEEAARASDAAQIGNRVFWGEEEE